jgi:CubicO group peptidase (beta-lactamase class C family)
MISRRFPLTAAVFVCSLLAGCGNLSSNVVAADQSQFDVIYQRHRDIKELVDSFARPLTDSGRNVGIVVGVLDEAKGKHIFGYGKKSLDSDETPDGDTLFGIGSLTKTFVTLLYQQLVDDKVLDPTETVGSILPEQHDFSEAAKRIPLYRLVNHSSGLPRQPNDLAMLRELIHYSFTGDNIYRDINRDRIFSYLREFDPDEDEIDSYRYSNIGMGLLGYLIEVKTGKSLPSLLDERIIKPLHLADTTYAPTDEQVTRLASGYVGESPFFVRRNTPVPNWDWDDMLKGAAGLYSTANDLLRFAEYRLASEGTPMLSIRWKTGFFTKTTSFHVTSLGWDVDVLESGKRIMFQHGMIAGFSAYVGIDTETGIAVVALYNNFDWDDTIGDNLLLTFARNGIVKPHSSTAQAPLH